MSEIADTFFPKIVKLEVGQAIWIRTANKSEQKSLIKDLEELKDKYEMVDSVIASQLFIYDTLKDRKQYVVVERRYRAPFVAFLKDKDNSFSKITLDPDRLRMIRLMINDGYTKDEVNNAVNGLTEDEINEFFLGK